MLTARTQLAAKVEVAEGTAETLTGAEAILVGNPSFKPSIATNKRDTVSSSLSPFGGLAGGARSAVIEFDMELRGLAPAGSAPKIGVLLTACGLGEALVAVTSATYKPASATIPALTMALYTDGLIKKIWGARGTVSFKFKAGTPVIAHFVFTGADFSITDGAMLTTGVAYDATIPPIWMAATLTIDSYAAMIETMDINIGNKVALRPDANAISGYKSAVITGREPTMSIDPELPLVAGYDFFGKWRSGNLGAFTTAMGTGAGCICTITAPKVQYMGLTPTSKNGIEVLNIEAALTRNAGDDELSIAFT